MSNQSNPSRKSRVVIQNPQAGRRAPQPSRSPEVIVALTVIGAAALATAFALFLTSRPFNPMISSVNPQQEIPLAPSPTASAKPTPTLTPSPAATVSPTPRLPTPTPETTPNIIVDDAAIQTQIEERLASDPQLAQLDVSTLVESGKVTLAGSVRSNDLKQRVERVVRSVKGVISVDNQLVVLQTTPD